MLRPAIMSGLLSDMLTASLAKHSRSLVQNKYFNGHPDLLVQGVYPNDSVRSGSEGIEIKTTRKAGGAVDTHGARDQWMCVFVYDVDHATQPAVNRQPMAFTEIYLGHVTTDDFRKNPRGTWNQNRDAGSRWNCKIKTELDLSSQTRRFVISSAPNRVGGRVTPAVLPHHRTCGSASGGS
jgi:hypothetical protein